MTRSDLRRGSVSWMARNPVAANLLALTLVIGGIVTALQIKQEIFPDFEVDAVVVSVAYPGASPSEVERGVVVAIEEAVRDIEGVDRITSVSAESGGSIAIELLEGTDRNRALADAKAAVDRLTTLPLDAERPVVSLVDMRREVVQIVLYGDIPESSLRSLADRVREDLLTHEDISYVDLAGVREREISVEIGRDQLRALDLTLPEVAQRIRAGAVELPGGGVKTDAGEVLLRTAERRDRGDEFETVPLVTGADGTYLEVGDVATVVDGFVDAEAYATFDGKPAARVRVFRIGDQTPLEVAAAVQDKLPEIQSFLPPGVDVSVWRDRSEIFRDRLDLLTRNAYLGLGLVLIILGLFLEIRLAFWVTLGIPISFLGGMLFLPAWDVSFNMITMFAFIVSLGMVVDDAIVVGENVYSLRRRGLPALQAAILGAQEMAGPVTFSILTSVAAFMPLLILPGFLGKIFGVIPAVVITVLLISLLESLYVLPAHLAHVGKRRDKGLRAAAHGFQQGFSRLLERFIEGAYQPFLVIVLRWRYATIALGLAALIATFGFIAGGRINFTFMPTIDSDIVSVTAVLPFGAPIAETAEVQDALVEAARRSLERLGGERYLRGLFAEVGALRGGGGPGGGGGGAAGEHVTTVYVYLVPTGERSFNAVDFSKIWREEAGEFVGLESLQFDYTAGSRAGAPLAIRLSHESLEELEAAASELALALESFAGVRDVNDGWERGKPQLNLTIRPEARSLGVTANELGRQTRSAFFGAEALRQQRGRDEIRVMARLPRAERSSEHDIEDLLVRTATGGEVPLFVAADVDRGHSYTQIHRDGGRRILDVSADVIRGVGDPGKIVADLRKEVFPRLSAQHPGLTFSLEGEQREMAKAMTALKTTYPIALVLIFTLLAIPFRSYVQPLVVMSAIPFGLVGAVIGHVVMGFNLSLISMMGLVALSGVVVNDSLILVNAANTYRREGDECFQAIWRAGGRRFRPILLTSLTTFFGLAPMIFETSVQARFMIPMAVSLGFGILFATVIVLLLVPCLYLVVEDLRVLFGQKRCPQEDDPEAGLPSRRAS